MQGGDDLADDFVLDETVALSDDGDAGSVVLEDEDAFVVPLQEDDDIENAEPGESLTNGPATVAASDKKRKRREKEKERKKRKVAEFNPTSETHSLLQTPEEISDYLCSIQKKSFPKYSDIEFDDIRIPASAIQDTTSWTSPRTLDHLVNFIINTLPSLRKQLQKRPVSKGAPSLMYIGGAALRVADVTRELKDKRLLGKGGGEVAKLFARHFKLAEHVTYLKRTQISIAVGTPGRLGKLLNETDALDISNLTHIILDITHRDAKTRNLLEIPETRDEVFKTIFNHPTLLQGIREGRIQVVLF